MKSGDVAAPLPSRTRPLAGRPVPRWLGTTSRTVAGSTGATTARPTAKTSSRLAGPDAVLGTTTSAAATMSDHRSAGNSLNACTQLPTPCAKVRRMTAARCRPVPSRTSCALQRRRTVVKASASCSACRAVVERACCDDGRQARQADQRACATGSSERGSMRSRRAFFMSEVCDDRDVGLHRLGAGLVQRRIGLVRRVTCRRGSARGR